MSICQSSLVDVLTGGAEIDISGESPVAWSWHMSGRKCGPVKCELRVQWDCKDVLEMGIGHGSNIQVLQDIKYYGRCLILEKNKKLI